MAFSKAHLYPVELQVVSTKMKAIAYPARQQILFFLLQHGPSCVHDIANGHHICEETLSGHLALLRKENLVSCVERYPYTFYQINKLNVRKTIHLLRAFLDQLDQLT
jgi:DNA-binding transcriptional ArsR family regulator